MHFSSRLLLRIRAPVHISHFDGNKMHHRISAKLWQYRLFRETCAEKRIAGYGKFKIGGNEPPRGIAGKCRIRSQNNPANQYQIQSRNGAGTSARRQL